MTDPKTPDKPNGVRKLLLMGVFWRILFIEAVLLVYSLLYRWWMEGAGPSELFWYAVRILILVAIIIVFMMITLKKFLTHKIIIPLESLAQANKETQKDYLKTQDLTLPKGTPDEIMTIATSRAAMLKTIVSVSEERLNLVKFIKETFGRYLSDKVVDEILTTPKGRQIGGTRKTVTVLMSDLRGFTSISERRDPEEMVQLLNRYLERMSKIILKYDGIIDEILGDAILAVFGAPEPHKNDPERAVACAIEMQNNLAKLNQEIQAEGHPPLEMGIGINTGPVIVGNIGSELRMKYGIVGDTVNRASRIESNSVGGQVLVGQTTFEQVRGVVQSLSPRHMMMKGLQKPLVFHAVTAICSRDFHLTLESAPPAGQRVPIQIPLACWKITDKKLDPFPIAGESMAMSAKEIHALIQDPLPQLVDVKVRFDFCLEAHCFEEIYAKVAACDRTDAGFHCLLAVTFMADKDKKILMEWNDQAID